MERNTWHEEQSGRVTKGSPLLSPLGLPGFAWEIRVLIFTKKSTLPPIPKLMERSARSYFTYLFMRSPRTDVIQTQVQVKQIKIFLFDSRNEREWVSSQLHARLVGQSIDSYYTVNVKRVHTMVCRVGRGTLICERWMAHVSSRKIISRRQRVE